MPTLSCGRNSSRSVMRKRCHIYWRLFICIMPLSLEQLQCVLVKPSTPSAKAVSPRKASHKSLLLSAPTAPIHTFPGCAHCLGQNVICKSCSKKVTGIQSATVLVLLANNLPSPMELRRPPLSTPWKGKES